MPDWIRTSGLWSRSYQAVKPETAVRRSGLIMITNFGILKKKPRALQGRASEVFAVVVK